MNGFKKCKNGHFYKEDIKDCPYCPGAPTTDTSAIGKDLGRTMVTSVQETVPTDETEVFDQGKHGIPKTTIQGGGTDQGTVPNTTPKRDLGRTFIGSPQQEDNDDNPGKVASAPRATRKIVGWVISYTLDEMGVDYRIYEGRNTIGCDPKNTIPITKDSTISGEHVIILFKNGSFKIKDKMTTNGTFLNGEELEVEEAYDLHDGDELRLGNTVFKFKSAL
ncbi:MAG: FHA domain-containing protein [Flavobacteriia bacterium]|jgi:hypothetical protein|nr:FHA domain-containing protein [Flavobacteriia bacterium]